MIHLEIKFLELLLKNRVVFDAKIKFHFEIKKPRNAIITNTNKAISFGISF